MYPTLFRVGDISVSSFSVMVLVAFLVAYKLGEAEFKRKGLSLKLCDLLLGVSVIGGLVGAKVLFLIQNVNFSQFMAEPVRYLASGLTFLGGLLLSILLFVLVTRWKKVSFWLVGDAAAPGLVLAYAIGRVGCFLVGDDYGTPSRLPWAMAFPKGSPPTTEEVHPTQIYTTLIMAVVFISLWKIRKKDLPVGWLSALTFIILGVERFLMEFIRNTTSSFIPGLSQAQLISVGLIIVGVLKLIQLRVQSSKVARLET
jgi:phosphatidylglycerol:prolipoprotein diacylglycerol transferase